MKYTSTQEAPEKFHLWTAISTIAAVLRREVWLDMGHFRWFPNFYIVFVGKPGIVQKSTTMTIGLRLASRLTGKVFLGPSSGTYQALLQYMAEEVRQVTELPDGKFYRSTPVTLAISELGTFLNTQDTTQIDHLVDFFDCKDETFVKRTIKDGELQIVNPWLNLIACTTPSWVHENFPSYMIGGGFVSRTIFIHADSKRRLVAYPNREREGLDLTLGNALTHDLMAMSELHGPFRLTDAAYEWGTAWYENLHTNTPTHLQDEKLAGYVARKQSHMHKVAMILSIAESDSLVIDQQHLETAELLLRPVEDEMLKVFGKAGVNPDAMLTDAIADYITKHGPIAESDIYNYFKGAHEYRKIRDALALIGKTGQFGFVQKGLQILVYKKGTPNG